jgi:hypothetical protein
VLAEEAVEHKMVVWLAPAKVWVEVAGPTAAMVLIRVLWGALVQVEVEALAVYLDYQV